MVLFLFLFATFFVPVHTSPFFLVVTTINRVFFGEIENEKLLYRLNQFDGWLFFFPFCRFVTHQISLHGAQEVKNTTTWVKKNQNRDRQLLFFLKRPLSKRTLAHHSLFFFLLLLSVPLIYRFLCSCFAAADGSPPTSFILLSFFFLSSLLLSCWGP